MAMLIDVFHLGRPQMIGIWLLPGDEPALVDCGPAVCGAALEEGLAAAGLALEDVRHLLLTHVHLDHAGGAGALVRRHPGLQVHVSEAGAPHVVDPSRLEASARQVYGEAFDGLFGSLEPVPQANVHVLGERVLDLEAVPTPGHAWHHVSFFAPDGACYTGDAVGVLVPPGGFLYPASAPPGIDLDAWSRSLDAIEARRPTVLRLPHFGEVADPPAHLARMRERLGTWAERVRSGMDAEEFARLAREELRAEGGADELYPALPSFEVSYAGLARAVARERTSTERS